MYSVRGTARGRFTRPEAPINNVIVIVKKKKKKRCRSARSFLQPPRRALSRAIITRHDGNNNRRTGGGIFNDSVFTTVKTPRRFRADDVPCTPSPLSPPRPPSPPMRNPIHRIADIYARHGITLLRFGVRCVFSREKKKLRGQLEKKKKKNVTTLVETLVNVNNNLTHERFFV